jgi:hypothetical protein
MRHRVVDVAIGGGSIAAGKATRQVAAAGEVRQFPRRHITRLGRRFTGVVDFA